MLKQFQTHEQKTLASSGIATLNIPTGGKIHDFILRFATAADADATVAAIKSEIALIRLTINGKELINASPTKLFDLYSALGQHVNAASGVAGVIELNLGRLVYTDPTLREIIGFGTADVQSIQVAVTAGTLSTIASVQAFTARTPVNENMATHCRYINYPVSFNATGAHTMDTMPRDPDSAYLAVLTDAGASGTITHSEIKSGSVTIREKHNTSVNKLAVSSAGFAQPSGYHAHLFTDGAIDSRLPMVNVSDLRFINTFSVAPGSGGYNQSALTIHNLQLKQ